MNQPTPPGVDATAARVLALAAERPATLGSGRLVCVDGPAGSGKTTLAAALLAREARAVVVHVDDLLDGWDGLPTLAGPLEGVVAPLAQGDPGSYRRYDWHAGAYAESVVVPVTPLLVIEGVGSGSRTTAPWCTVLVWVEVDPALRMSRGLARDGVAMRPAWEQFMRDEQVLFADEGTRGRADVVV